MPVQRGRKGHKKRIRFTPIRPQEHHESTLGCDSFASPVFESLDEMQQWVFNRLLRDGIHASPRGLLTRELPPTQLILLNPRRRIVTSPARRWSLPLGLGEFCWHLSGSNDVAPVQYYSDRWHEFADQEGKIRGSCYGFQIFRPTNGTSQWLEAQKLLRYDSFTRRAVLVMSQPLTEASISSKDVACASSLQFLLRHGKLDAVLHMRSNDAFWGLPYDVFFFTMLQELLAAQLNMGLGVYYHSVGSLHLYERHIRSAEKILEDKTSYDLEMPPLTSTEHLSDFLTVERELRDTNLNTELDILKLPVYWRQLAEVLLWQRHVKRGEDKIAALKTISEDSPYLKIVSYLVKRGLRG